MNRAGLNHVAVVATLHCLLGCAIGEVVGMVIGTAASLPAGATVALSVLLAFVFGYALSGSALVRAGLGVRAAAGIALAADTVSIAVMEVVDNLVMLVWPGAMDAGPGAALFWGALAVALAMAFVAALPVNRALIARGRGHAVAHGTQG